MYRIKVIVAFSAAHNLRGYKGKCEKLHGHNWRIEVICAKEKLNKSGMVHDFSLVKRHLKEILKELDHQYLNRLGYFRKTNPTSENIARYLYDKLREKISYVEEVAVWESDTSAAIYRLSADDKEE